MAGAALLKFALLKCEASQLICSASKLKCAASKLPNLRQLTGLQSCEGSVLGLAGVGMAGGTCISRNRVCSKLAECCINLCHAQGCNL